MLPYARGPPQGYQNGRTRVGMYCATSQFVIWIGDGVCAFAASGVATSASVSAAGAPLSILMVLLSSTIRRRFGESTGGQCGSGAWSEYPTRRTVWMSRVEKPSSTFLRTYEMYRSGLLWPTVASTPHTRSRS